MILLSQMKGLSVLFENALVDDTSLGVRQSFDTLEVDPLRCFMCLLFAGLLVFTSAPSKITL